MLDESDESQDVDVEIEGYVVEMHSSFTSSNGYVFVATKVTDVYKMSI